MFYHKAGLECHSDMLWKHVKAERNIRYIILLVPGSAHIPQLQKKNDKIYFKTQNSKGIQRALALSCCLLFFFGPHDKVKIAHLYEPYKYIYVV